MKCAPTPLAFLLVLATAVATAGEESVDPESFVDKEFVIVDSTPSFEEAAGTAISAASKLGVRLDLRGLSPHERTGLTFSKEECSRSDLSYPCYVPRGRYDDGMYVSVEWSNDYRDFAKGLYLVMVASNVPGSSDTSEILEATRRIYPEAYARRAMMYVGCMH